MKTADWLDAETLRRLQAAGIDTTALTVHADTNLREPNIPSLSNITYYNKEKIKPLILHETSREKPRFRTRDDFEGPYERLARQCDDSAAQIAAWKEELRGDVDVHFPQRTHPDWRLQQDFDFRVAAVPEWDWRHARRHEETIDSTYLIIKEIPKKESSKPRIPRLMSLEDFMSKTSEPEAILADSLTTSSLGYAILQYVHAIGANPFRYLGVQDDSVVSAARRLVTNHQFVDAEAIALTQSNPKTTNLYLAACDRYTARVVPALSGLTSLSAMNLGLATVLELEPNITPKDALATVGEQVDRVNFCRKQVKGILEQATIQDAYASAVATRAEQLGKTPYRV